MRKIILFPFLLLCGVLFFSTTVNAQISTLDTLTVESMSGQAGSTIDVVISVQNTTINVATWTLQMEIDTNVIVPVYTVDNSGSEPAYYPEYAFLFNFEEPDFPAPVCQYFPETQTITGIFVQVGSGTQFSAGDHNLMTIKFRIKDDIADGTTTRIDLFNDYETPGGIIIGLADLTGLESVDPTLRDGIITVSNNVIIDENAPIIEPLSSPITVQSGQSVSFSVTASDPDGDNVTLSASNLPSGATFETKTADSLVTSTFNWPSATTGNYTVTFKALDDTGKSSTKTVSIQVEQVATDNLYVQSTTQYGVQGGIPGTTGIAVPVNLQEIRDIYGFQFDLEYDPAVCRIDSTSATDRLDGFTIYENLSLTSSTIRLVAFGSNNESIGTGSTGNTIMYIWVTIKSGTTPGYYPFKITDAWESINPDPSSSSIELAYDVNGQIAVDMLGDVNLHPPVDIADLVSLVGYIIGDWSLTDRQFRAANVNEDTEANVVDLVAILNTVLGGGSATVSFDEYVGPDATIAYDIGALYQGELGTMNVNADLPADVGAVQLVIDYDPAAIEMQTPTLSEKTNNLTMRYRDNKNGHMVVVMHFKSKDGQSVIPAGLADLVDIPVRALEDVSSGNSNDAVNLSDVIMSTPQGGEIPVVGYSKVVPDKFSLSQNYPNPFNPTTTIKFEIMNAANSPGGENIDLVIYNILGQRVKTLLSGFYSPGQYTVVWDGTDDSGSKQASGVYFYSIISEKTRVTKKMVLQK